VDREDAAGVAHARTRTRVHARELRDQLQRKFAQSNASVWVAVQNRGLDDEPDQYFMGRALRIEKVHDVAGNVGRVRYDVGDLEIAVEWFQRDVSGGDERRIFKQWTSPTEPDKTFTFNSTELRAIDVRMQLVPPLGGVPLDVVRRPPARGAANQARTNWRAVGIVRRVHEERATPPEQLWEVPAGEEIAILLKLKCCP